MRTLIARGCCARRGRRARRAQAPPNPLYSHMVAPLTLAAAPRAAGGWRGRRGPGGRAAGAAVGGRALGAVVPGRGRRAGGCRARAGARRLLPAAAGGRVRAGAEGRLGWLGVSGSEHGQPGATAAAGLPRARRRRARLQRVRGARPALHSIGPCPQHSVGRLLSRLFQAVGACVVSSVCCVLLPCRAGG